MQPNDLVTQAPGKVLAFPGRGNVATGARVAGFAALPNGVVTFCADVEVALTPTQLLMQAPPPARANGVFVGATPQGVGLGTLTGPSGFFVSDQFGGCDFTLLRNPGGQFVAAHVYSDAACRAAVATPPPGWTVIYTWQSKAYAALWGMNASIVCFALIEGARVSFVVLKVSGMTATIGEARLSTQLTI